MNDIAKTEERRRLISPASNVLEDSGNVRVIMEMPGVAKSDLDIQVKGLELTVIGHRQETALEGTWLLRERRRGDFQKTYSVDATIDLGKEMEIKEVNFLLLNVLK